MSYFNDTGVRRSWRNAGLSPTPKANELSAQSNITTLPDEIYQHIFGYALGDKVDDIFTYTRFPWIHSENYRLQYINKTFRRVFRNYIKTSPLCLDLVDHERSLQLVKALRRYDVSGIKSLHFDRGYYMEDGITDITDDILKALDGINFTSLRELILGEGGYFDFEILKECKELEFIRIGILYVQDLDKLQAEKLKTFLSLHNHTVESLELALIRDRESYHDVIPNDLVSWPKLKKLYIDGIHMNSGSQSKVIESSSLQYLRIRYDKCDMVIKCPNLKVLLIENIGRYAPDDVSDYVTNDDIDLEERSCKNRYNSYSYPFTCHPSKLRKFGIKVVEVSSNCDVGLR